MCGSSGEGKEGITCLITFLCFERSIISFMNDTYDSDLPGLANQALELEADVPEDMSPSSSLCGVRPKADPSAA
jgi:hypothetical protein